MPFDLNFTPPLGNMLLKLTLPSTKDSQPRLFLKLIYNLNGKIATEVRKSFVTSSSGALDLLSGVLPFDIHPVSQ